MPKAYIQLGASCSSPSICPARATGCRGHLCVNNGISPLGFSCRYEEVFNLSILFLAPLYILDSGGRKVVHGNVFLSKTLLRKSISKGISDPIFPQIPIPNTYVITHVFGIGCRIFEDRSDHIYPKSL